MLGGKSTGVAILWLWAIGTAAVLVVNVATTRMRDMEKLIKEEEARSQSELLSPSGRGVETVLEDE